MGDGGDCRNVQHVQARVAHGFAKKEFGVGAYSGAPAVDIAGFDKGGLNTEAPHGVVQEVLRAAIKRRAGDDVRTGAHQRGNAQVQRCLPAGGGYGAYAAFKRRHTLLQHRIGRVADARVHMPRTLQVEQAGCVVAGFKDERSRQVNRNRACAGGGVGCRASVQRECVKARVRVTGHGVVSIKNQKWRPVCGFTQAGSANPKQTLQPAT